MLKIFKNKHFFCKNKHKKGKFGKAKKRKVVLVNNWKHRVLSDRVLSVFKTKIPTEYRENDLSCFKN